MFVNGITQIDHAYIDTDGMVVGEAINLGGRITGEIEENEQVVIDFSACKKQIKHLIDDTMIGMDHKLVVYSNSKAEVEVDVVFTPRVEITNNSNVCVVDFPIGSLDQYINREVSKYLSELHGTNIVFESHLDTKFVAQEGLFLVPFTYVHGLKNSSSYGCQNIAHGHRSYMAIDQSLIEGSDFAKNVFVDIVKQYDGKVFVNKNDMEDMRLSYESFSRGQYDMVFKDRDDIMLFDTDTTVENLAIAIARDNAIALKSIGVKELYVSEGLTKGAVESL